MDAAARREIGKGWAIAIVVIAVALALTDLVVLKGEPVDAVTVPLRPGEVGLLEISRAGEEHRVRVSTRRRVRGEMRGSAVAIRLAGPDGSTIHEESELVARKTRSFEFVPAQAGTYRISVDDNRTLLGNSPGAARVSVTVNDRRILGRLLDL